jgi:hypothetical protein
VSEVDVTRLFLEYSRWKLEDEYWPRLRGCVESLTDEQVWWRPNAASNSVGNLLMHLEGNVRQWLVAAFDRAADLRDRPAEFAAAGGVPRRVLLDRLGVTISEASRVLAQLTTADLTAAMVIQGYTVTGLDAVYQVIEHFGLHYGQIVYVTKMLRGEDLGFYRELSATGRKD